MNDYEYNDLKSEILSEHYIIQLCSGFTILQKMCLLGKEH